MPWHGDRSSEIHSTRTPPTFNNRQYQDKRHRWRWRRDTHKYWKTTFNCHWNNPPAHEKHNFKYQFTRRARSKTSEAKGQIGGVRTPPAEPPQSTGTQDKEGNELYLFQSLIRDEAIEYWQSSRQQHLTTSSNYSERNLQNRTLRKWRVTNGIKPDMIPQQNYWAISSKPWSRRPNKHSEQISNRCFRIFMFGNLPVDFQQELTMAKKENSSPEEIITFLMRKNHYQQMTTTQTTIQHFNAVTSTAETSQIPNQTPQPERKKIQAQLFYCGGKADTGKSSAEQRSETK